jgi:cytochrome c oxidase subunit 1
MHFLGLSGLPRRYYSFTYFDVFDVYAGLNTFISVAAFLTFAGQLVFLYNFFVSIFKGRCAEKNPWRSNTLEWTTPIVPPEGNWDKEVPTVYRWPYDYSVPGASADFIPQDVPPNEEPKPAR